IVRWRAEITSKNDTPHGQVVAELVWQKVAEHVPPTTHVALLAPDGELCNLPWAALPDPHGGRPLVRKYAFALVPHGPFLLERLPAGPEAEGAPRRFLAVGDINYGHAPAGAGRPGGQRGASGDDGEQWGALRHTGEEISTVTNAVAAGAAPGDRV